MQPCYLIRWPAEVTSSQNWARMGIDTTVHKQETRGLNRVVHESEPERGEIAFRIHSHDFFLPEGHPRRGATTHLRMTKIIRLHLG